MKRLRPLLPIFFGLIAGCSSTSSPEHIPLESSERLLAGIPDGWHRTFQMNSDGTRLSDFVAPDETDENWTTKLSFESFDAATIPADPITLLESEAEADRKKCNFVQHFNIHSGYENNYETSVRLFLCGENAFTEQGEVKLIKLIRGKQNLYAVRIVRRIAPFAVNEPDVTSATVADWSQYLRLISVCDGSTDHPCPTPALEN